MAFNENLSDIVFEDINSEYGWGKYGEFKVLIRKSDGYINATKLCKNGGKELFNYMANDSSQKLIDEIVCTIGIPRVQLVEVLKAGSQYELNGTYVHQDLVPHIASWISPKFAIKVSKIVNNIIVREYKDQIRVKDTRIDELDKQLAAMNAKLDQQLEENRRQSSELKKLVSGSTRLERSLDVANENVVCALQTLGSVSDRLVPAGRLSAAKNEWFLVLHLDESLPMPYYAVRAQEASVLPILRQKRRICPNLRFVVDYRNHPNARELWNAVKTQLGSKLQSVGGRAFNLEGLSEDEFVALVERCNAEKQEAFKDVRNKVLLAEEDDEYEVLGREEEDTPPAATQASLLRLKMVDLRGRCRENQWKGWSKLSKLDLVEFILARQ